MITIKIKFVNNGYETIETHTVREILGDSFEARVVGTLLFELIWIDMKKEQIQALIPLLFDAKSIINWSIEY